MCLQQAVSNCAFKNAESRQRAVTTGETSFICAQGGRDLENTLNCTKFCGKKVYNCLFTLTSPAA